MTKIRETSISVNELVSLLESKLGKPVYITGVRVTGSKKPIHVGAGKECTIIYEVTEDEVIKKHPPEQSLSDTDLVTCKGCKFLTYVSDTTADGDSFTLALCHSEFSGSIHYIDIVVDTTALRRCNRRKEDR